jgi:hypothetical protein
VGGGSRIVSGSSASDSTAESFCLSDFRGLTTTFLAFPFSSSADESASSIKSSLSGSEFFGLRPLLKTPIIISKIEFTELLQSSFALNFI